MLLGTMTELKTGLKNTKLIMLYSFKNADRGGHSHCERFKQYRNIFSKK